MIAEHVRAAVDKTDTDGIPARFRYQERGIMSVNSDTRRQDRAVIGKADVTDFILLEVISQGVKVLSPIDIRINKMPAAIRGSSCR